MFNSVFCLDRSSLSTVRAWLSQNAPEVGGEYGLDTVLPW